MHFRITMMIRFVLTRNRLLALSAAVVLLLGFADLARGGVTLAPVLLVAGYLVLVPLSLWPGRRQHAASATTKRPQRVVEPRLTLNRRGLLLASPVLLVAFVPLVANWHHAQRRGDYTTAAFAHDLLDSVEPYGVLVTYGDNDTFPLWYAQEVEGIRKVTVGDHGHGQGFLPLVRFVRVVGDQKHLGPFGARLCETGSSFAGPTHAPPDMSVTVGNRSWKASAAARSSGSYSNV